MIIHILGSPRSGKTTTASRIFSSLKEAGFNSEYIPEQARFYIAEKKVKHNIKSEDLVLTDTDQFNIMKKQYEMQDLMLKACGDDSVIVTDSSPLNSLLYMTEEYRKSEWVQQTLAHTLNKNNVFFYSLPVEWLGSKDPNRVHTEEESAKIDKSIETLLFPLIKQLPTYLTGDVENRARTASSEIFRALMNKC